MSRIETCVRLELDPEPVALWHLRSRPDDFRQPEDSYADLATETTRRMGVLTERLAAQLQALHAARTATTFKAQRRFWLLTVVAVGGFVGALILGIWPLTVGGYLRWIVGGLVIIGVLASSLATIEYGPARRRWAMRRESAQNLEDAFQDAVGELLREIILERTPEEQSWGSFFDSRFAPTLVGIGTDQATSSSSYTELVQFIAEHPTSAIGIAGPRGVGKSTLMEKLTTEWKRDSIGVRIPAPKRYEPGALVRLTHSSIAQEILHPGAGLHAITDPDAWTLAAFPPGDGRASPGSRGRRHPPHLVERPREPNVVGLRWLARRHAHRDRNRPGRSLAWAHCPQFVAHPMVVAS